MNLSPRHEKFAQLVASGEPAGRAYEKCGYRARTASADSAAEKLMRKVEIRERIAELQKKAADAVEISREALLRWHLAVLGSVPQDASFDSPLCEIKMSKAGPYAAFPDKQKSADAIAKICGYYAPEKKEITGDAFAAMLAELRARK